MGGDDIAIPADDEGTAAAVAAAAAAAVAPGGAAVEEQRAFVIPDLVAGTKYQIRVRLARFIPIPVSTATDSDADGARVRLGLLEADADAVCFVAIRADSDARHINCSSIGSTAPTPAPAPASAPPPPGLETLPTAFTNESYQNAFARELSALSHVRRNADSDSDVSSRAPPPTGFAVFVEKGEWSPSLSFSAAALPLVPTPSLSVRFRDRKSVV